MRCNAATLSTVIRNCVLVSPQYLAIEVAHSGPAQCRAVIYLNSTCLMEQSRLSISPSKRGTSSIGKKSGAKPVEMTSPTMAEVPIQDKLQICVIASGSTAGLLKTIASIERAVEIAISFKTITFAALEIASLGGEWSPESDNEGILSKTYPHISVRGRQLRERETKAGAYNQLVEPDDYGTVVLVQGGVSLAVNTIARLVDALRSRHAAAVDARRLPIEAVQHYDRVTGRIGHASPFCLAISAASFRAVGGFEAIYFPNHLFTFDFLWKARSSGLPCILEPAATYYFDDYSASTETRAELIEEIALLAHKWSNVGVRDRVLAYCRASCHEEIYNIANRFQYRSENGYLPSVIENGNQYTTSLGDFFLSQLFQA